ncbi:MAG TPA: peptidoglycan-associated lipoprotein Pal [Thermoanaerobaculia bacterium]|nr:peptidoglycan-associated lipoprotein Pal [Thermoanaerobaculia bacterium]
MIKSRPAATLSLSLSLSLVLAAAFASACAAKKPQTAATSAAPPPPAAATSVAPPVVSSPSSAEADVLSADLATLNRQGYLKDAFFDYDQSVLRADAREALNADAGWLKKYPSTRLLIEGHCDERGTEEYNLALGDRRAAAVREYLAALGVTAARVQTVSYGKERPFCGEENEPCYQQNRRGHLLITAK